MVPVALLMSWDMTPLRTGEARSLHGVASFLKEFHKYILHTDREVLASASARHTYSSPSYLP